MRDGLELDDIQLLKVDYRLGAEEAAEHMRVSGVEQTARRVMREAIRDGGWTVVVDTHVQWTGQPGNGPTSAPSHPWTPGEPLQPGISAVLCVARAAVR